ncbi:MAG: phosphatidylglycerophosphatase A [Alysiella sp.]|uniref:phosphatidylglycerophosphatase A family protein n=1 Tax=Alysiella sp. TaxID=1872483 RepID=UPI0026DC5FF4|nr:phosphatidylglycerophosphatase A [Alysiella sp.]MDO4433132.1 phosphatidylglycerophosphatase A [Alysiella sp.]
MSQTSPTFRPTFTWLLQDPIRLLGFGFGTGLSPKAPGTIGTLAGVFLAALLLGMGMSKASLLLMSILLFFIGIWICNITERALGVHDYGGIVWDEIVAIMVVLACVPQGLTWWLTAFITFRFFDAVKPPPIRWFDHRIKGGLGIMLDDIIAAIMSIIVVQLLWQFI